MGSKASQQPSTYKRILLCAPCEQVEWISLPTLYSNDQQYGNYLTYSHERPDPFVHSIRTPWVHATGVYICIIMINMGHRSFEIKISSCGLTYGRRHQELPDQDPLLIQNRVTQEIVPLATSTYSERPCD